MPMRDTTNLLVRRDAIESKSWQDAAMVIAFGAIGWPWLLRSLSGGRRKVKAVLVARLGLPADALPNLGSWKADVFLLERLLDIITADRPAQILELGCGATSLVMAQALALNGGGQLTGYDQHGDFVDLTAEWLSSQGLSANLRHAPLAPAHGGWPGHWYQLTGVPDRIDLLVIDGPPWTIHPFVRGSAEILFDRIPVGGSVVLDDAARPGERIIARRWRKNWPGFEWTYDGRGTKGTLIGRRVR